MGNKYSSIKQETPEKRQRRLQQEYGVLIPPCFLTPTAQMPPSCQSLCKATLTPDLLEYLWATNPGRRLLQDYLSPGVFLLVGTGTRTGSSADKDKNLLVSLQLDDTSKASVSSNSLLWIGQAWKRGSIEALVPTAGQPSLTALLIPVPNLLSISANLNADGKGWVGARLQVPPKTIPILLGAYVPFESRTKKPSTLHAYGAAEYHSSLAAVQAEIPLTGNYNQPPKVSTMVSLNVNDKTSPPLWLTLKQQQQQQSSSQSSQPQWIMNLSQTLTFDRNCLDFWDDRAPFVRQTLGWVVQLTKNKKRNEDQNQNPSTPELSVGAAWQWNRGFGIKGVVNHSSQTLVYGMVFQRWMPPRVTLSVLNQWNFITSKHSFLGLGVELETTGNLVAEYQTTETNNCILAKEAPVTKLQLPKHLPNNV
jgi:hypothetical protein